MKPMTKEEYQDRIFAIQRARKLFIETGLTNNISSAFEAYQLVFAERERQLFLSSKIYGNRTKTFMDRYERPKCPDCGADMLFRQVKDNPEGIKVQLVCNSTSCDTILNSEHDIDWWMNELRKNDDEPK